MCARKAEGGRTSVLLGEPTAPEFRTQNLSAATPLKKAVPPVAPYKQTLPTMMFSSDLKEELTGGRTTIVPNDHNLSLSKTGFMRDIFYYRYFLVSLAYK